MLLVTLQDVINEMQEMYESGDGGEELLNLLLEVRGAATPLISRLEEMEQIRQVKNATEARIPVEIEQLRRLRDVIGSPELEQI